MRANLTFVLITDPGYAGYSLSERVWEGEEPLVPVVRGDTEQAVIAALKVALRAAGVPAGTSIRISPDAVNFRQTGPRPR